MAICKLRRAAWSRLTPSAALGEAASDTVILDFWIPEQWGDKFVLFKPPGLFMVFVWAALGTNTGRGPDTVPGNEEKCPVARAQGPGGAGSSGWLHWVPVGDAREDLRWKSFA